jgi:hypothetical protein
VKAEESKEDEKITEELAQKIDAINIDKTDDQAKVEEDDEESMFE